jgi:hypothetical protein
MSRPSPVPQSPGAYAWYFDEVPGDVDAAGCHVHEGRTLLYVGISPAAPPQNGRVPSRSTLKRRLQTHYSGNASGSTLRLTLGCLLSERLGIQLRRVGSGGRYTFTNPGEQQVDTWMAANAFVAWQVCERPWELEKRILEGSLALPLNIADNPCTAHTTYLSRIRRAARSRANELEIIVDNGGPRRTSTASATPSAA